MVESVDSATSAAATSMKEVLRCDDVASVVEILKDSFGHCADLSADEAARSRVEGELRSLFSAAKRLLAAAQGRVAAAAAAAAEGGGGLVGGVGVASRLASDTFGVALSVAKVAR